MSSFFNPVWGCVEFRAEFRKEQTPRPSQKKRLSPHPIQRAFRGCQDKNSTAVSRAHNFFLAEVSTTSTPLSNVHYKSTRWQLKRVSRSSSSTTDRISRKSLIVLRKLERQADHIRRCRIFCRIFFLAFGRRRGRKKKYALFLRRRPMVVTELFWWSFFVHHGEYMNILHDAIDRKTNVECDGSCFHWQQNANGNEIGRHVVRAFRFSYIHIRILCIHCFSPFVVFHRTLPFSVSRFFSRSRRRGQDERVLRAHREGIGLRQGPAPGLSRVPVRRHDDGIQGEGRQRPLRGDVGRTGHPCTSGHAAGTGNAGPDPAPTHAHGRTSLLQQAKVKSGMGKRERGVGKGNYPPPTNTMTHTHKKKKSKKNSHTHTHTQRLSLCRR